MRNFCKYVSVAAFMLSIGTASLAFGETGGQYIDDAAITTKVKAALLSDSQLKATKVSVETTQGAVKLTGSVDNKTQETEAIRVTNQVDGVKSVKDLLSVKNAAQSY